MCCYLVNCFASIVEWIKKLDVQRNDGYRALRRRDTIVPIAVVSVALFCMWGLAYGLLDVMNYHVRNAMGLKREEAAIMAAGYYAAYIPGTLFIGGPLVTRCGYRVAMCTGLFLLATGDFFMSLGAERCSLAGMVLGQAVIGHGVSCLERCANAYAVNCGPRIQANLRILMAQTWAGIGTVIAPYLANVFVFDPDTSSRPGQPDPLNPGKCLASSSDQIGSCDNLGTVVSFYRYLGLCIYGLMAFCAIIFFRTRLVPEVFVERPKSTACGWKLWKHPLVSVKYARLWWGFLANFVNISCQVTFAQFYIEHMKVNACASDKWAAVCFSIAQAAFVVGRVVAAGLVVKPQIVRPRWVLAAYLTGAVATTAAGTSVTGPAAISLAVMVMFFEGPSFPMIFESATADFGEWSATCETMIIISISGGAVQVPLLALLDQQVMISKAWWLTAACFALVWTYPMALNLIPAFRRQIDGAESQTAPAGDEETAGKMTNDIPLVVKNDRDMSTSTGSTAVGTIHQETKAFD